MPVTEAFMAGRNAHNDSIMVRVDARKLERLYQRLLAGEKWNALAYEANTTATGLKSCLRRAGYDLGIRAARKAAFNQTRDIPTGSRWDESRSNHMLRVSLRVS